MTDNHQFGVIDHRGYSTSCQMSVDKFVTDCRQISFPKLFFQEAESGERVVDQFFDVNKHKFQMNADSKHEK